MRALISSALILLSASLFSQHLNIGIKGGQLIGFNDIKIAETDMQLKSDFTAGLFHRLNKKNFYMLNELMISRRGALARFEASQEQPKEYNARLLFLDINALPGFKHDRLIVNAGPSLAVNLRNRFVSDGTKTEFDADAIDLGYIISIGGDIPIENPSFSILIEGRFSQYFKESDITENLRQISILLGFVL